MSPEIERVTSLSFYEVIFLVDCILQQKNFVSFLQKVTLKVCSHDPVFRANYYSKVKEVNDANPHFYELKKWIV